MSRSSGGDDGFSVILWLSFLALVGVAIGLWWAHRLTAWGFLFVSRDAIVYLFGDDFGEVGEVLAVIFWRAVVPALLFIFCASLVSAFFAQPRQSAHWLVVLSLSLSAGGVALYHYFRLYAQKPPNHHSWPKFVAADIKLRTTLKLRWIEEKLRWKL